MPPVPVHRRSVAASPAPLTSMVAPPGIGIGTSVSCLEDGLRFVAEVPPHNPCQRGRIVENWIQFDNLGLLQQLGVSLRWDRPVSHCCSFIHL